MDFLNEKKNSKNIIALKASIYNEFKENVNRNVKLLWNC